MRNCGHCHRCGTRLDVVLDGEEWCPRCKTYRRYHSHGFPYDRTDEGRVMECPDPKLVAEAQGLDDAICSAAWRESHQAS